MEPLLAKSPALFDMVKDCTTPAQTLLNVAKWLHYLISTSRTFVNMDNNWPLIIGIKEDPKLPMVCKTFGEPSYSEKASAWFSYESVLCIPSALYQVSEAMKKQGEVTNTVHDAAWSAIREKAKQEENEATNRLVNNLNKIITKYLDVGEALGLVGHDRGLIAAELFSDGETRQIGKSHECILRKIKAVRTADLTLEQYRPVHERMNEMKAENAEQREHLAAWHGEMIHLAKNLKVIDDKDVYFANDAQHAKDLGDKVGTKCYEMRTKIKKAETELADMSSTISFLMGMYWDIVAGVREYPEADQDALHKELGAASRWKSPEDGSASIPSTAEHEKFCRWLRERLQVSEMQAISITEHKTALNAAHDEIAKLKAELAALKAAPPSPPPSDPLTTAYAVIGEMVVKSRQG